MFAVVSQITKRRQTFHNSCRTGAASSGRIRNNSVQIWRAVRYEVKRFCTELKFDLIQICPSLKVDIRYNLFCQFSVHILQSAASFIFLAARRTAGFCIFSNSSGARNVARQLAV